jgi:hypothetical protein
VSSTETKRHRRGRKVRVQVNGMSSRGIKTPMSARPAPRSATSGAGSRETAPLERKTKTNERDITTVSSRHQPLMSARPQTRLVPLRRTCTRPDPDERESRGNLCEAGRNPRKTREESTRDQKQSTRAQRRTRARPDRMHANPAGMDARQK